MEKILYMIGNAHIDPVWLWRWQDGFSEIRATFRSALDRMNEYPDFVFTSAAASFYAWIEQNDPDMFEEIRARVREGRWAVAGGWWIQPDCNIPSGESFARQALTGQRYFREKFGVTARTGYNVDAFGHSGLLPKILRQCGMDRYVFMRPGCHEKSLPGTLFRWESPEGESVVAFRIPYDYCTWGKEIEQHVRRGVSEVRDGRGVMNFYGVGNHGGGPTRQNLDSIAALDRVCGARLVLSSPDAYFDQAEEKPGELPVVNGDLFHHASGCYSAHSGVKRLNRKAENRLLTAEKWSALAGVLLGKPYPGADLTRAWKKVLFNQFHDILAGTSLVEAYDDAAQDFGFALSVADEHINDAQQALMRHIRLPFGEGDRPIVAFNPHAFDAHWPAALECAAIGENTELLDDQGNAVPYQLVAPSAASRGRVGLRFAANVPALGYRAYRLAPREGYVHARPAPVPDDLTLENEWIRAEFSPETGNMTRLFFKPSGEEMLDCETEAQVLRDDSDTWSHNVLRFHDKIGAMALEKIERVEDGACLSTIRVTQAYENSRMTQDFTLYRDLPVLFVSARVNWQQKLAALKLRFRMPHHYAHVTAQAAFGYVDRPCNGEEFPMLNWVDMTGAPAGKTHATSGMTILNDCKYSYDARDRALHLTVLRSPYFANHMPFVVEEGMNFPVVDQGWQSFQYALYPHDGMVNGTKAEQYAALLNAPVELLPESFHDGQWAGARSFVSVAGDTVALDALKLAEDGSGDMIVHLHETARQRAEAELVIAPLGVRVPLTLGPGEIKALRVARGEGHEVTPVNLLEDPV